jgi:hypothetical protein
MKKALYAAALIAGLALVPTAASAVDLTVTIVNTSSSTITRTYADCSGAPCPSNLPFSVPAGGTSPSFKMSDVNGGPLLMTLRYGSGGNIGQWSAWNAQWGGAGGPCASPFAFASKNAGNPQTSVVSESRAGAPSCAYSVVLKYGP